MLNPKDKDIKNIIKKYESKLADKIGTLDEQEQKTFSREYSIFKKELLAKGFTRYENYCRKAESLLKVEPGKKDRPKIEVAIETAHLDVTPTGAMSFAVFAGILFVSIGLIIGVLSFAFLGTIKIFFPLFFILFGVIAIIPLSKLPVFLANRWRLKASNQMVLCILYVVMYMRHTSNLEHAIRFAAQHIGAPLSLDLRKIFWDIETGRYHTIKESLDSYLGTWRGYNDDFIESFHLIEASLYESTDERRVELLDKALSVMLEGTYERMLHYAHDLKSPITILHMLGVVLPILGLVIFPLLSAFAGGVVKWYHLAMLYNIILPLIVFFIGVNILAKRPTGYGEAEIDINSTQFKPYRFYHMRFGDRDVLISPVYFLIPILFVFLLLGFLPLLMYITNPGFDFEIGNMRFLDYKCIGDSCAGPYGLGALILSLFIPLGIAIALGIYYRIKSKELIKIRSATVRLEKEFSGSLFQLGNRIGDGLPVEVAFGKVAENMQGTTTGNFFSAVTANLTRLGMGLRDALFDSERGAVWFFPSNIIEGSMKILLEGAKKGPQIVSRSLISISNYINKVRDINERLRDLLADVVSSMKGQVGFLTPVIAGIVVGIGSMITNIIGLLGEQLSGAAVETGELGPTISPALLQVFNIQDVMPPFYFQLVVGLYVVQITIILTILSNGIENGFDKVMGENSLGKNLFIASIFYFIVSITVILIFNTLAAGILATTLVG